MAEVDVEACAPKFSQTVGDEKVSDTLAPALN